MSGCLIFHRPAICSMTSLESIRTSTGASGSPRGPSAGRRSIRCTRRRCWSPDRSSGPRPSRSHRSPHRAPTPRTPPVRDCRGNHHRLPRSTAARYAAPAAVAVLRRRTSLIRPGCRPASWGSQPGLRRADQDAAAFLAAQHLVGGRRGIDPQVGGIDVQLAAGAASGAQFGRANSAVARADLGVELQQVVRQRRRGLVPDGPAIGDVGVQFRELLVALGGDLGQLGIEPRGVGRSVSR